MWRGLGRGMERMVRGDGIRVGAGREEEVGQRVGKGERIERGQWWAGDGEGGKWLKGNRKGCRYFFRLR